MILERNGLQDVPVGPSPGGPLSDHYDPRKRSVHLSEPVFAGDSVASVAIAAHEVGHALQHHAGYGFFKVRSAMWPAVAFASSSIAATPPAIAAMRRSIRAASRGRIST